MQTYLLCKCISAQTVSKVIKYSTMIFFWGKVDANMWTLEETVLSIIFVL